MTYQERIKYLSEQIYICKNKSNEYRKAGDEHLAAFYKNAQSGFSIKLYNLKLKNQ